ncbi:MAG: glycosyltransferase family 2 protein [Bacteroidales bacterium]|nr:glycosyltransferase family 2 protein [Candidatus Liminaster caballi]
MVSVFIPTHNASAIIGKTLQSVLSQTYVELEVWAVDDCSTDDTVQVLKDWQKRDSRLHIISKEKNEGFVPYSWNRVFPLLKGEFTLYMSHDDYLSPDCIALLVKAQQETGADCVIPDCVFTYDDGRQQSSAFVLHPSSLLSPQKAFARMLNYDIPGFALWRTSVIRNVGMVTEAWNSDEGMQRIWALNCKNGVSLCPAARFFYRLTDASITRGLKPYHLTGLKTQRRLLNAAFANGIWWRYPLPVIRFAWQYLKSYRYLHQQLGKDCK